MEGVGCKFRAAGAILADGMTRRTFLVAAVSRKPNIVVVDGGRPSLSGVRFTQSYAADPLPGPAQAGLLTGRYPQRFSETTLAQPLKDAGYVTGHCGDWHLGSGAKDHPLKRGFKESFGPPVEEAAADFMRRHAKTPFFLYVTGELAAAFNENTLVFILGASATEGTLRENSIRTPIEMRWRGRLPDGLECRHPVISLDIFPTAVAAARGRLPVGVDGVNLLEHFPGFRENRTPPHFRLFWRTGGGAQLAMREDRFKWIRTRKGGVELYDLQADPGERTNLAGQFPAVAERLERICMGWNSELNGRTGPTHARSSAPGPDR